MRAAALAIALVLPAMSACDAGGSSFCGAAREWVDVQGQPVGMAGGRPGDTPAEIERKVQAFERQAGELVHKGLRAWREMEQAAPEAVEADVRTMRQWYEANLTDGPEGLIGRLPPAEVAAARSRVGAFVSAECAVGFQA